jgi:mRNA-degrading endonuclease RelE of RelBE toxin-antitoxin system
MTLPGSGGVTIRWRKSRRCHREYEKLSIELRDRVDQKLQDLVRNPRPAGLSFEKLKGFSNPDIYTVHVTRNYKLSMEITGGTAFLRRVAVHDEIDRAP